MIENRDFREHYLKVERSAEQRRKDLVVAFDQIFELKRKLDRQSTRLWVLSGALTIAAGVIGWLANHLFDCVQAAQKLTAFVK